jgi:hypothetical protein
MFIDYLFKKIGYIRISSVINQLDYARDVAKRLDEHRETVEAIQSKTKLFDDWWHVSHMSTQDDYLMRLFYMTNGFWPDSKESGMIFSIRPRPKILKECQLSEYLGK